jgi:hypothetical protein
LTSASIFLYCAQGFAAELLRDKALITQLLRTGSVDLDPAVAMEFPQAESELQIRRIGLQLDGHRIRAAFRDKSRKMPRTRKVNVRYKDAYYNEVAAYVIAQILGLDMVPVTVLREIGITSSGLSPSKTLRQGSLQLWIENALVEYDLREDRHTYPGSLELKNQQLSEILVFDCLIGNVDRHAGNILVDLNPRYPVGSQADSAPPFLGKLWAIDHSRAFHSSSGIHNELCKLERVAKRPISRAFVEGMRAWQPDEVRRALLQAGLSERQVEGLNLDALGQRLEKLRSFFEQARQDRGLDMEEFYSSGVWHRLN